MSEDGTRVGTTVREDQLGPAAYSIGHGVTRERKTGRLDLVVVLHDADGAPLAHIFLEDPEAFAARLAAQIATLRQLRDGGVH